MIDISKFDDLNDLPISEEMLGAYLEGNLRGSEFREVHNFIQKDNAVSDLVDSVKTDFNDMNGFGVSEINSFELSFASDETFVDFALPEISSLGAESFIDTSSPLSEDIILGGDCHNFVGEDGRCLHTDEGNHSLNHHDTELDCGITNIFE